MTTNKSTHKSNVYTFTPRSECDPDARLRAAFQAVPECRAPSETCPAPERIWAAVRMELPQAERRELVDHLATCPFCAEDWRIAWRLSEEERRTAEVGNVVVSRWREHLPQLTAAAALLVVAVGAGVILQQPAEEHYRGSPQQPAATQGGGLGGETNPASPHERTFRGGAAPGVSHSLLKPGEALSRQDFVLRWTAGPPGSTYEVQVMTEELDAVTVGRDLTETELRVPPEALDPLPSGALLLWQVATFLPGGGEVTSATFEVVLQ